MRAGHLLRTQAFRIVLVYVLLFAFSVTALLGFTYWNTRRTLDAQTDQIIEAEITGLAEQYQHLGLRGPGAKRVRSRSLHGGQALYLLTDSRIAGHRRQSGCLAADRRRQPAISSSSIMSAGSTASWKRAAPAAGCCR